MANNELGIQIRNLRLSRGMSQEELGKAIGVTMTSISRWEKGTRIPKYNYVMKLSEIFNYNFGIYRDKDHKITKKEIISNIKSQIELLDTQIKELKNQLIVLESMMEDEDE